MKQIKRFLFVETDAEPSHSQAISSSQATKAAAELDKEKAQREHHRTKFNDWLDNGYNKDLADRNDARKKKANKENTEKSHSTRSIIDKTKYNKILDYLLGNIALGHSEYDTQFKNWVSNRRYNLIERNGTMVLYQTKEEEKERKKKKVSFKDPNLEVAVKEDFFDILYSVHSIQRGK